MVDMTLIPLNKG